MGSISVLIAVKKEASRTLLESCLAEWGYGVMSAMDGEAAQALLQTTSFDICVLDLEMPGISGFEICKRLRSIHSGTSPFVVLVASQAQLEEVLKDTESLNEAGANDYITEPFDLRHLRHRIAGLAQIVLLRQDVRAESVKNIDWTGGPALS
jgi:DNA-binding response OmpR family regulator